MRFALIASLVLLLGIIGIQSAPQGNDQAILPQVSGMDNFALSRVER